MFNLKLDIPPFFVLSVRICPAILGDRFKRWIVLFLFLFPPNIFQWRNFGFNGSKLSLTGCVACSDLWQPERLLCDDSWGAMPAVVQPERCSSLHKFCEIMCLFHVPGPSYFMDALVALYAVTNGDQRPLWHCQSLDTQTICQPTFRKYCTILESTQYFFSHKIVYSSRIHTIRNSEFSECRQGLRESRPSVRYMDDVKLQYSKFYEFLLLNKDLPVLYGQVVFLLTWLC